MKAVPQIWQKHGGRIRAFLALALAWQLMSFYFPPYLVPGLEEIFRKVWLIFFSPESFRHLVITVERLIFGISVCFVVGTLLAISMSQSVRIERHLLPLAEFVMGIPSLALIIIVVIWFPFVELRIFTILFLVCCPVFAVQILDGIKGVPKELIEMLLAFRPTRRKLFTKLILPGVIPVILTSWKLAIAWGARAVITAELVGATTGIGNRLLSAQELFEMADALAWTVVLVTFLSIAQFAVTRLEAYLLRWRPAVLAAAEEQLQFG